MKQTANRTALCAGGSLFNIPKDNLGLLMDHLEERHKIQDNYMTELFVVVLKHKDPNVYIIHPLCGGPVHMVNQWQLFDLKKSSLGDGGPDPTVSSSPQSNLPFFQLKKLKLDTKAPHQHSYGNRSKTQTNTVLQTSDVNDDKVEYTGWRSLASSVFTPWV